VNGKALSVMDPHESIEADEVLLSPLVSDAKAQAVEYRRRNSNYEYKSVHTADTDEWVAKGWEAHKLGDRSTKLRRGKVTRQTT
jgi:hypothetical protein